MFKREEIKNFIKEVIEEVIFEILNNDEEENENENENEIDFDQPIGKVISCGINNKKLEVEAILYNKGGKIMTKQEILKKAEKIIEERGRNAYDKHIDTCLRASVCPDCGAETTDYCEMWYEGYKCKCGWDFFNCMRSHILVIKQAQIACKDAQRCK